MILTSITVRPEPMGPGYQAYLNNDTSHWGRSNDMAEAVYNVLLSHRTDFEDDHKYKTIITFVNERRRQSNRFIDALLGLAQRLGVTITGLDDIGRSALMHALDDIAEHAVPMGGSDNQCVMITRAAYLRLMGIRDDLAASENRVQTPHVLFGVANANDKG
jgi:hypothetical protein